MENNEEIIILDEDLNEENEAEGKITPPAEINGLVAQINALESQLEVMKKIEIEEKSLKAKLKMTMEEYGVKKWELPNGTKITLVEDKPDEEEEVEYIDHDELVQKYTELYMEYKKAEKECTHLKKEIKKGKSGYVRITNK